MTRSSVWSRRSRLRPAPAASATARFSSFRSNKQCGSAPATRGLTQFEHHRTGPAPRLNGAGRAADGDADPGLSDAGRPRRRHRRQPVDGQPVAGGQGRGAAAGGDAAADADRRPAPVLLGAVRMTTQKQQALAEFRRIMKWILVAAVLMVAGALAYLGSTGDLTVHTVVATVLGVFFSVLLGCGLFAAAFFSDKSGLDQEISDATRRDRDRGPSED